MPDSAPLPELGDLPPPRVAVRRWLPSLVWLVPIAAAIVGLSLLIHAWRTTGPRVTISFRTAEGVEVGKTLVKDRNVTIGHVTAIRLSADQGHVLVTADLDRNAESLATAGTRFWVVRPRIGVGWVSGLETLVSGAFIAAEKGAANTPQREFVGLENPPPPTHGRSGRSIVLHATELGSVNLGAPVYFRRFEVGQVVDQALEPDGNGVRVVVFIDAPNDRFIGASTRFWNASGIDVKFGADGMKLKTESLASVLAGGIAFETPPALHDLQPAPPSLEFTLFRDEAAAMAPPDGAPHYVRMRFEQSLHGLSIGAPVEFIGVNIGSVQSIDLDYDARDQTFPVIVTAQIYPRRMGRAYDSLVEQGAAESDEKMAKLVGQLVSRGLRAQPRPGNLLNGQLYLALDFVPNARAAHFSLLARPLEIPTVPSSFQELQLHLASIVTKIDRVPLNDIANHLDDDLKTLHGTLAQVDAQVLPAAESALGTARQLFSGAEQTLGEDAPWRESIEQTLAEARRTMRSVRSLTDYLNRHPEAVIRGRQREPRQPGAHATSAADTP